MLGWIGIFPFGLFSPWERSIYLKEVPFSSRCFVSILVKLPKSAKFNWNCPCCLIFFACFLKTHCLTFLHPRLSLRLKKTFFSWCCFLVLFKWVQLFWNVLVFYYCITDQSLHLNKLKFSTLKTGFSPRLLID